MCTQVCRSFDSSIAGALTNVRTAIEHDYLPVAPGDKFNIAEGLGALAYQPCVYFLSKSIRLFETVNSDPLAQLVHRVATVALVALTAVVAAVGFVIKRIGSFFPHDRTPRTDEVFTKTAPEKIDQVYEVMDEFSKVAKEIGLDYRMISGTALGAVRHGGIIPWDDDGDFAVMDTEKEKIDRAIADGVFAAHGLELEFYPGMENYQVRFTDARRGEAVVGALDLFLMQKVETNNPEHPVRIGYSSNFITEHFPHDFFTEQEWRSVEEWKFGPHGEISLNGINRKSTEDYVKRAYGEDCMTCGLKTHQHAEIRLFGFRFSALGLPVVTREKVSLVNFRPAHGLKWHE